VKCPSGLNGKHAVLPVRTENRSEGAQ
jgi:hypothetical protein